MATSPPIDRLGMPGDHDASPAFLTVDECAELLRVDRKTVYTAIRAGRLPALRLGRLFRIARSDIDGEIVDYAQMQPKATYTIEPEYLLYLRKSDRENTYIPVTGQRYSAASVRILND